jgi:hypothetical protein
MRYDEPNRQCVCCDSIGNIITTQPDNGVYVSSTHCTTCGSRQRNVNNECVCRNNLLSTMSDCCPPNSRNKTHSQLFCECVTGYNNYHESSGCSKIEHILNTPNWDKSEHSGNLLVYRFRIKDSDKYFGYDGSEFVKVTMATTEEDTKRNRFGIIVIEKISGKLDYKVYIRNARWANKGAFKAELLDHGGAQQGGLEFYEFKEPYLNRQFVIRAVTSTSYNEDNRYDIKIYQQLDPSSERGISWETTENLYDCSDTEADVFVLERYKNEEYLLNIGDPKSQSYTL